MKLGDKEINTEVVYAEVRQGMTGGGRNKANSVAASLHYSLQNTKILAWGYYCLQSVEINAFD